MIAAMAVAAGLCVQPQSLSAERRAVALPMIANKTITPRVVYMENPRFPKVSVDELWKVFGSAAGLVKTHFGITVKKPDRIDVLGIDHVFQGVMEKKSRRFGRNIGDFRNGNVDWDRVKTMLVRQIEKQKDPLARQIGFARPHLVRPLAEETVEGFAEAVIATFRARLKYWTTAPLADGHPVIGKAPGFPDLPYNEYAYWALMAKLGIGAEIIVTNQLVASVEYMPTPVHSSIRGGITGGATEYNPLSRLGSSVWVSLFPYLSDDRHIQKLRGGDTYARDRALKLAGVMLAHEMGHQLLHLGHPWSNRSCVMRPAEVLNFAAWAASLNAARCRVGSSPAMTPGVLKIPVW